MLFDNLVYKGLDSIKMTYFDNKILLSPLNAKGQLFKRILT